MKTLFEEYGSVILVAIIMVALIATTGFLYRGDGTGWLEIAFEKQGLTMVDEEAEPVDEVEVKSTVYSLDFIEKNKYLYAIGATQPEYAVAAFNMEFSEVFILVNSSGSDGLTVNADEGASPISQHALTIKKAFVEDGVKNIGDNMFSLCDQLESITISSSVESISSNAFYACYELETIYGQSGSYAETYANENGYVFVAL